MNVRWVLVSLGAGVMAAAPMVIAQQVLAQGSFDSRFEIEELTPGQIQRAQEPEAAPKGSATSAGTRSETPPRPAAPKQKAPRQAARTVGCSGAFSKESSHIRLVTSYKSENVAYTEVDAPEGKRLMASVLFPKDPKRRLEVWWANETARSGTYLIVINGRSTWSAPKGVRLGLPFAALEKLNGKPFKVKGFDADNVAVVSDWQDGALASLPGGCNMGVSLRPDARTSADARKSFSADREFVSNDAGLRTIKATVSEILIGY
jgi:hypothetical protein